MTLYHFGNCLALIYAPYHMAYKFSGISEYATFSKCVYAGGLYIFTQLCKMLLLATFFPDTDTTQANGEYDVFLEILKATVDYADLVGLYFAMNAVPGKGHAKILTAAIGWASAEVVVTRSVPLWVGARGAEFSWRHVRAALGAGVALAQAAAAAALVWLCARRDLPRRLRPPVLALLALLPLRPAAEELLARALLLGAWPLLALRAAVALGAGLAALGWYAILLQMCFSTHLDLLFTACYVLENWLPAMGSRRDVKKQYIHNELTKESFTNNTVNADVISHDDYVSIHWHLGNITATKYNMSLIHKEFKEDMEVSINDQCSTNNLRSNEIVCMLSGLNGSYQMDLAHTAPWKVGDFGGKSFVYSYKRFEYQPRGVPAVASPRGVRAWAWACGVLAAACGALLACAAAARWRGAARFRKRVLDDWRQSRLSAEAAAGAPSPLPAPWPVLLLYARDGPPAAPLVAALTRLLELAAPAQVLDLFAPRTVALAAAAPHDWLREAFRREDVRVVLLQTPALACFYPTPYTATLEAPLLADEPEPGDALLALALRLLASAGDTHTPLPYTKYYLATVGELETETLPYTVPFRRYVLPADAERLLRDLLPRAASPPTAASSARAAVHSAADSFVRHAQRRPGYLRDQLRMAE